MTGSLVEYFSLSSNASSKLNTVEEDGMAIVTQYLDRFGGATPTMYEITIEGPEQFCSSQPLPFPMMSPWNVLKELHYMGRTSRDGILADTWGATSAESAIYVGFSTSQANVPVWVVSEDPDVSTSTLMISSFVPGKPSTSVFNVPSSCSTPGPPIE